LENEYNTPEIKLGLLDITLGFSGERKPLEANETKINFIVEKESNFY
jgi:pyrimidine operon attenuation protein/uracil phosphoribosyltransferase